MVRPAAFEQRVYVVTTLSSLTAPSAAQVLAGVDITADLPDPVSFGGAQQYLDASDISSAQDKQQTGTIAIENLEFEIWRHKAASQLAYDALPNGAVRYIVKFEGGDIAGANPAAADRCDVAQVTVGIKTDVPGPRNSLRRVRVPAAISSAISWRVTLAA